MIPFACPRCDTEMRAPNGSGGEVRACPSCNKKVIVPDDEPEEGLPVRNDRPVSIQWAGGLTESQNLQGLGIIVGGIAFGILCFTMVAALIGAAEYLKGK